MTDLNLVGYFDQTTGILHLKNGGFEYGFFPVWLVFVLIALVMATSFFLGWYIGRAER